MKRVGLLAAIALLAIATAVRANETSELTAQGYKRVKVLSLASSSRDTPPWSATAYEANVANPVAPRVPARLCFSQNARSSRYCFLAEAEHHGLKYAFQKVEDLVLRQFQNATNPVYGVLFGARFRAGGSGNLRLVTLWSIPSVRQAPRQLLPRILLSKQSEYRFVRGVGPRGSTVFTAADYVWGKGETHFSAHRFTFSVYTYDSRTRRFVRILRYVTARKYPSFDDVDVIDVIRHEIGEIRRRL